MTKFESDLLNSFVSVLMEADIVPVVVHGPDHPGVPHEGLVVPDELHGVVELPAVAAVVLETRQIPEDKDRVSLILINRRKWFSPAEVRTLLQQTVAAQSILKVGINLHLLGELQRLDLNEGSGDRLHVALGVAEGDSP